MGFDNIKYAYENYKHIKEGYYHCVVRDVFLEREKGNSVLNVLVEYIDLYDKFKRKMVFAKYYLGGNGKIKTLTMLFPVLQQEGIVSMDNGFNITEKDLATLAKTLIGKLMILRVEQNGSYKNLRIENYKDCD